MFQKFSNIFYCYILILLNTRDISCLHFPSELSHGGEAILQDLLKAEAASSNRIEISLNVTSGLTMGAIGNAIDYFLSSRPWWYVIQEPNKWSNSSDTIHTEIILGRYSKEWLGLLQHIASCQYPVSCDVLPFVASSPGLDSFGNSWYNWLGAKSANIWGVFSPVLNGGVSFLDPKQCPQIPNKYDCAFVPATNCSLPDELLKGNYQYYWTNAGHDGKPVDDFHKLKEKFPIYQQQPPHAPSIPGRTTHGLFKAKLETVETSASPYNIMFGYAFLFRPNHHYRSMIAHIISTWKKEQAVPWPDNNDCVAVRIRRTDRTWKTDDIIEWCRLHVIYPNGSCYNDETHVVDGNPHCVRYHDMGCSTGMPYQAMTLEHTLNASRTISSSKNVLVGCDDAEWLKKQIATTKTDLNIFPFTAPPNHRSSAHGGAHYMAAIELSRQCSALVGHTGSAVTMFFYNIMCARHGGTFGKCPPLYDFSGG